MDRNSEPERRPFSGLVSDLWRDSAELIRGEAALAKAELSEKAARIGTGIAWLAAGTAVLLAGLIFLLVAAVAAIAQVLPEEHAGWLAPLLVGVAIVPPGLALFARGRHELRPANLKPAQSVRSVRKDVQILKEHLR